MSASLAGLVSRQRATSLLRVGGSVSARFAAALATFILQALAAHQIGAAGLGTFALLYSIMLVFGAVCNGLVGDSLTALNREDPALRAGLMWWFVWGAAVSAVVAALGTEIAGVTSGATTVIFGVTTAAWIIQNNLGRLLMAVMRFWSLLWVNILALVISVGLVVLLGWRGVAGIDTFLLGLAAGQLAAAVAAVALLPAKERSLPRFRPAAIGQVAGFGVWRAGQQVLQPALLTVVRAIVVALAGSATLGHLEAARLLMAPALLMVQGLSAYLFASYARNAASSLGALRRRADVATVLVLVATAVVGLAVVLARPLLAPVVTGGGFSLSAWWILGWAVYAAASGTVTPVQGLAAVRGRQRAVAGIRLIGAIVSLLLCAILVGTQGLSVGWVPVLLAGGSLLSGVLIRRQILAQASRTEVAP